MYEHIVYERETWGTETSKYPQEKKINNDSLSSGERTRKSLNQNTSVYWGLDCGIDSKVLVEVRWKARPKRVTVP